MTGDFPWRQRPALEKLLADWRQRLVGASVSRVTAGPGWVGLTLVGQPATFLFLIARPGAALLWDALELPPRSVCAALGWQRRPPLASHLRGQQLVGVELLPSDRIVALLFRGDPTSPPLYLLHQLFGSRGNLVLLDQTGRLLWRLHRSPHPALTRLPPATLLASPPRGATGAAPSSAPPATPADATPAPAVVHPTRKKDIAGLFRQSALTCVTELLTAEVHTRLATALRRALTGTNRLVSNLQRDLASAVRSDEFRATAETLAIHLHTLVRGAAEVMLEDAMGNERRIALDPALGPAANMEHYFRLARKAARGRAIIAERLTAAVTRLKRLRAKQDELAAANEAAAERLAVLLAWRDQNAALLGEAGVEITAPARRPRVEAEPGRPFRRYRIEDKWEVWIGRNNQENDRLTHHTAAPSDLWFHAQGVPGSHVILRTAGRPEAIPKRILNKVAALAALHSKARHSSWPPSSTPSASTCASRARPPLEPLPVSARKLSS